MGSSRNWAGTISSHQCSKNRSRSAASPIEAISSQFRISSISMRGEGVEEAETYLDWARMFESARQAVNVEGDGQGTVTEKILSLCRSVGCGGIVGYPTT